MIRIDKEKGIVNELIVESDGLTRKWRARLAGIEDVRKSFEKGYAGPDIAILFGDGTDSCIHASNYLLSDCEAFYMKDECVFFFDEDLPDETSPFFVSSYEDFTMTVNEFRKDADAVVVCFTDENKDLLSPHIGTITKVISRSEDPEHYDNTFIPECEEPYDFSAEFVTDDDIYYIFVKDCDHI